MTKSCTPTDLVLGYRQNSVFVKVCSVLHTPLQQMVCLHTHQSSRLENSSVVFFKCRYAHIIMMGHWLSSLMDFWWVGHRTSMQSLDEFLQILSVRVQTRVELPYFIVHLELFLIAKAVYKRFHWAGCVRGTKVNHVTKGQGFQTIREAAADFLLQRWQLTFEQEFPFWFPQQQQFAALSTCLCIFSPMTWRSVSPFPWISIRRNNFQFSLLEISVSEKISHLRVQYFDFFTDMTPSGVEVSQLRSKEFSWKAWSEFRLLKLLDGLLYVLDSWWKFSVGCIVSFCKKGGGIGSDLWISWKILSLCLPLHFHSMTPWMNLCAA